MGEIDEGNKVAYLILLGSSPTDPQVTVQAGYKLSNDAEYDGYVSAINELNEWAINRSFALLVNAYGRFMHTYNQIQQAFTQTPSPDPQGAQLELNSELIGLLCMVRFYLDSTETRLKRLPAKSAKTELKKFKEAQSKEYDSIFAYRFCYRLRNYAQHCGMPITNLHATGAIDPKISTITHTFNAYFQRDVLLKNFDWQKVKTDLEKQPEEFPVSEIAVQLIESLKRIEQSSAKAVLPRLNKANNLLKQLIKKNSGRSGTPYLGVFPADDDGKMKISNLQLKPIPIELMGLVDMLNDQSLSL